MTSKISHNVEPGTLASIFSSRAREAVLRVFMVDPYRAYYQRQIAASCGQALRAVQRELERLTAIQLLYRRLEGNRAYYHVDVQFPLFPELRSMILKTGTDLEQLRGHLAMRDSVRLAFKEDTGNAVLVVTLTGKQFTAPPETGPFEVEVLSSDEFVERLSSAPEQLDTFLRGGVDLLGRREDMIWHRIEAAGFSVRKGKGVP